MPKRRGRPPRPDARRRKLGFKASREEAQRIIELADLNGQSVAEFIRDAVLEAAADCSDIPVFRPAAVISVAPKKRSAAS